MRLINDVNPAQAYYAGEFAAFLESISMTTPLTESRIEEIKEDISHYCEATIDHSQLSYQEKEEQKRQMKQSLEVYIQGLKDELKREGRIL